MQTVQVRNAEDFKLFRTLQARFDARGGIRTQYPLMWTGMRAAGHIRIDRPVFLHCSAAQPVQLSDVHGIGAGGCTQERFETYSFLRVVDVIGSHFNKLFNRKARAGREVNIWICSAE